MINTLNRTKKIMAIGIGTLMFLSLIFVNVSSASASEVTGTLNSSAASSGSQVGGSTVGNVSNGSTVSGTVGGGTNNSVSGTVNNNGSSSIGGSVIPSLPNTGQAEATRTIAAANNTPNLPNSGFGPYDSTTKNNWIFIALSLFVISSAFMAYRMISLNKGKI